MKTSGQRERLNNVLFYGALLLLGYLAYQILRPFLVPLAWAGILALCVRPVFNRLNRRFNDTVSALLGTVLVAVLLVLPISVLAILMLGQISQAISALQAGIDGVQIHGRIADFWAGLQSQLPIPPLAEVKARLIDRAGQGTALLAGQAGSIVYATSSFILNLFIMHFALYFLQRDGRRLGIIIRRVLPFGTHRNEEILEQTHALILAGSLTTLTVAATQGLAGGVIFGLMGLHAPLFWGCVMGFCALIPLVGTSIVWGPAALWLIANGSWPKGALLIALGLVVIGGIDNILRPLLISGRSSMNGLVVFISMLGGIAAFGFIGLVLGPVVAAAAITLLKPEIESHPEALSDPETKTKTQ